MTIRDVARRARVSPATVSRVLTGSAVVREDVRMRVLEAIRELGYRPNQVARNLRRQKAEMIGLVIADIENPFFAEMVRAVEDAAYRLGYRVVLCNTDEKVEKQRSYLGVMAAERLLGVILAPSDPGAGEIAEILDLGIPIVAFDRAASDPRADSVTTDNVAAGRMATRHLLDAGHERIALISPVEVTTGIQRVAGYEEAMHSAGLEPLWVPSFGRVEGGMEATDRLLHRSAPPTALIGGNGMIAMGALKALRTQQIAIPEDVALVVIDDLAWTELVEPPLTALAQPVKAMATTAVDLLTERIVQRRAEARHIIFDFELRVRGSSAVVMRDAS